MIALFVAMFMTSCNSCKRGGNEESWVETVQKEDAQYMVENFGDNYDWLECCIDFKNFIDSGDCEVAGVANIYRIVDVIDSQSFVQTVVLIAHTPDTMAVETKQGIWVGDNPLNAFVPFNCDFNKAVDQMMRANCPKPHSKHCVLRKEVGPRDCNPQYIFGNQTMQVYVDAVTGEVNTKNPVFEGFNDDESFYAPVDSTITDTVYGPRNTRIGCPLGEWP